MKKILCVLLLIVFAAQSAFAVPSDLWTEDLRVENLFSGKADEQSEIDIIQKLLGYLDIIDTKTLYADQKAEKEMLIKAFAAILEIGEEEAYSLLCDTYLREGDKLSKVTFKSAVHAFMTLTGYVTRGENETKVFRKAKESKLLYNIKYGENNVMTQGELVQMIYNALVIPCVSPLYYAYNHGTYQVIKGDTFLRGRFDVTLNQGIVTASYGGSIYPMNTTEKDEIYIDDIRHNVAAEEDFSEFVGCSVAYFEHGEKGVICAEPDSENDIVTILPFTDVEAKSTALSYMHSGKRKTFRVDAAARVIYNGTFVGMYSMTVFNNYFTQEASLKVIDNDNNSNVDIIMITHYNSYAVSEVSTDGVVAFKYDMLYDGKGYIDLTPEEGTNVYADVYLDGKKIDAASIKKGSIISITDNAQSNGHTYIKAIVSNDSVSGRFDAVSDNEYTVSGELYYMTALLKNAQQSYDEITIPQLGKEYTFLLDANGVIADITYAEDLMWAFLVRVGKDTSSIKEKMQVKLFTEKEEMIVCDVDEKKIVLYDKDNYNGRHVTIDELYTAIVGTKSDYRGLVKYKLNSQNELTHLYLSVKNEDFKTDGPANIDYEVTEDYTYTSAYSDGMYYYNGVVQYQYYFPLDNPLFYVPREFSGDDSLYQIKKINSWGNNNVPNFTLYSIDEYYVAGAGVMYTDERAFLGNTNLFLIKKMKVALGEDKIERCCAVGWQDGNESEIVFYDDGIKSSLYGQYQDILPSQLKEGDVIQTSVQNGYVMEYRVIYRMIDKPAAGGYWRANGSAKTASQLETSHAVFETVCGTLLSKKNNALRISLDISSASRVLPFFITNSTSCYVYNAKDDTLTKHNAAQVNLYEGKQVLLQKRWSEISNIYVFEE